MQSSGAAAIRFKRIFLVGLIAVAATLDAGSARADEPVIGGGISAAVPLSKFKSPADVGGGFDIYGGYRFNLTEHIGLSLLGGPDFSFFPNEGGGGDDAITLFDLMAGPRLSIGDGGNEVFIDGRGGYAWDLSGPIDDDGAAFSLGGGVAFELVRGTALTLFSRYNESEMRARPGTNSNLRWVNAGIGIQHRFLGPEPMERVEAAPVAAAEPPMKKRLVLRGVNFDFDKATIRADARPVLDEAVRTLQEAGDIRVAVEGHTDSRGTDQYNQGLSIRRAQAVADYLTARGIARSRLQVDGYGESRPVASNDTDDGRAQNRRVELSVVP
jgi:outer membrane protein OmpA-like peptidoglycan-associated protein